MKYNLECAAIKRYGDFSLDSSNPAQELFIENRIYDIEKINISGLMSNHIIIIGFQDNIQKLIKYEHVRM